MSLTCPVCNGNDFDGSFEFVEGICSECSFVIEDRESPDKNLSTKPHQECHRSDDTVASISWDEFCAVENATEAQLKNAFDHIESVTDQLGLSIECRKTSAEWFTQLSISNATDGISTEEIICSLLHLSSRKHGRVVPIVAFDEIDGVNRTSLNSLIRKHQEKLEISIPPSTPSEYLPYIEHEFELDTQVIAHCEEILAKASKEGLTNGKHPMGVTVAVLYEVTGGEFSQRELAEASGITKETIRQRLSEMRAHDMINIEELIGYE